MAVHSMSSCNIAWYCASLGAIGINGLPDILVHGIAIDTSRKWEEQERRPIQGSYQAATEARIVEPVCLTGCNAHTIRCFSDTQRDTMADSPATVTQKSDLHKHLVSLTYFLRYGAAIPLIKHANKIIGEGIGVDVSVINSLFHLRHAFLKYVDDPH
jgi:hypothetical protein